MSSQTPITMPQSPGQIERRSCLAPEIQRELIAPIPGLAAKED